MRTPFAYLAVTVSSLLLFSTANAALIADFSADTLGLGNVTTWSSSVGGFSVSTNSGTPVATANVFNGHQALTLNGSSSLRSAFNNNPVSGASAFSFVVTFKTSTLGVGGDSQWYQNSGLVDMEQGGVTSDWGSAFNASGHIGAGIGNGDATAYSTTNLADGEVHTFVYTYSGNTVSLYVDALPVVTATGGGGARNSNVPWEIGRLQTGFSYFTGQIAAIQFYDTALNATEAATAISAQQNIYAVPEPTALGLTVLGAAGVLGLRRRRKEA
jgi:hypothetical protein